MVIWSVIISRWSKMALKQVTIPLSLFLNYKEQEKHGTKGVQICRVGFLGFSINVTGHR